MRANLQITRRLVWSGFRQQSTYRLAALGGLVANATFGFLKVAILFATVRAAGGELNGYDVATMSAYIWLSQGLLGSVNLHGRSELTERIKSGDVTIDFLRPLNVQLSHVASEVGASLFALIPRGLPSIGIGVVVVGMAMPDSPWPYLLGFLSVVLGITLGALVVYAIGTSGFWLIETRGIQSLYMVVSGLLAGLFVPIGLFPTWLLAFAEATPFPSMLMYPVDILSGRVSGVGSLRLVGVQCFWLGLTWLAGHFLTAAGRRKLEVQGG
ncbi:MAG: ABC-2 family transporter protein [Nocardioides sp.]|nr:ABC-2 family transporter protein [Nocardioides sp.]